MTPFADRPRSRVWGVSLMPLTFAETLAAIDAMVRARTPGTVITANLHYAMLASRDPRLAPLCDRAAVCVADGMPLVWASRWRPVRLPERVAGSDLLPAVCRLAAERGYGVFFLGGAAGVAEVAAKNMQSLFPGLRIAGVAVPPFRDLSPAEDAALDAEIRAANADILMAAFSQPRGELWLEDRKGRLNVPVLIQLGASIDFAAGRVRRSPRWMQRVGLEWAYRLSREPRRMAGRYWADALFALRMLLRDAVTPKARRG